MFQTTNQKLKDQKRIRNDHGLEQVWDVYSIYKKLLDSMPNCSWLPKWSIKVYTCNPIPVYWLANRCPSCGLQFPPIIQVVGICRSPHIFDS